MTAAAIPPERPTRQPLKPIRYPDDLPTELLFDPPAPLKPCATGLNMVVCAKQVPRAEDVKIDPETGTLKREGAPAVINPPDENAVELALEFRARFGGRVCVVSMGPPQAARALEELLARGADDAVLLSDRAFAGADTYPTSLTLAAAVMQWEAETGEYVDLVICGEETTDSSTSHVGPGIAEHLGYHQATFISELDYDPERRRFRVKRHLEGAQEVVEIPAPAVITASLNMNRPRLATLRGKVRAKLDGFHTWKLKNLGLPKHWLGLFGSPTKVGGVDTGGSETRDCTLLEGSVEEQARELLRRLVREGVL